MLIILGGYGHNCLRNLASPLMDLSEEGFAGPGGLLFAGPEARDDLDAIVHACGLAVPEEVKEFLHEHYVQVTPDDYGALFERLPEDDQPHVVYCSVPPVSYQDAVAQLDRFAWPDRGRVVVALEKPLAMTGTAAAALVKQIEGFHFRGTAVDHYLHKWATVEMHKLVASPALAPLTRAPTRIQLVLLEDQKLVGVREQGFFGVVFDLGIHLFTVLNTYCMQCGLEYSNLFPQDGYQPHLATHLKPPTVETYASFQWQVDLEHGPLTLVAEMGKGAASERKQIEIVREFEGREPSTLLFDFRARKALLEVEGRVFETAAGHDETYDRLFRQLVALAGTSHPVDPGAQPGLELDLRRAEAVIRSMENLPGRPPRAALATYDQAHDLVYATPARWS